MSEIEAYAASCQSAAVANAAAADAVRRFSAAVYACIERDLATLDEEARTMYHALVADDVPLFDALARAKIYFALRRLRD